MTINPAHAPITSRSTLTAFWQNVLGASRPQGRSLWLAFHDENGRVHKALTQIDGLALRPDADAVANLALVVSSIAEESPDITGALVLLERGGTSGASPFEESWADALTLALEGYLHWPVMVAAPGKLAEVPLWTSAA